MILYSMLKRWHQGKQKLKKTLSDFLVIITINQRRIIMKENRVGFYAGLAGGFGFYLAWMILVMLWQTTTPEDAAMKDVLGFSLGLAVGVLLYHGVFYLANKKSEEAISKRLTRNSRWGIAAGLVIAFLIGLLVYNPAALWMPLQGVYGWRHLRSLMP